VVTTTPRATTLLRNLMSDPTVVITRGHHVRETARNLAPAFFGQIIRKITAVLA